MNYWCQLSALQGACDCLTQYVPDCLCFVVHNHLAANTEGQLLAFDDGIEDSG